MSQAGRAKHFLQNRLEIVTGKSVPVKKQKQVDFARQVDQFSL